MKNRLLLYTFTLLYSILMGFSHATLQAQEAFADRYNINYITMNEGLPHNFIDDIYKDSRGFLWISMAGAASRVMTDMNSSTSPPVHHIANLKATLPVRLRKTDSDGYGPYRKEA